MGCSATSAWLPHATASLPRCGSFSRPRRSPAPMSRAAHERKLIVELAGATAGVSTTSCRAPGFAAATASPTARPAGHCAACVPVRIAVERFAHTRSTRRVAQRQSGPRPDASGTLAPRATTEQFAAVRRLSALAPPRQRHGGDELRRLPRHGRGQPVRTAIVEYPRRGRARSSRCR